MPDPRLHKGAQPPKGPRGREARPWALALLCAALGMACAMAFVLSPEGYVGLSQPPVPSTSLLWTGLGACFGWLFWQILGKGKGWLGAAPLVFGLAFGVFNFLGTTLFAYDTWAFLGNPLGLALAVLKALGQGLPMAAAIALVDGALRGGLLTLGVGETSFQGQKEAAPRRLPRLRAFARRHPTAACALLLLLAWSPYLLVFFPGTLSWDMGEMLHQFFGLREMDTWHPVFTTWLLGACFWLGRLLGGDNVGTFLFTLLQSVTLALALGYAVTCMARLWARRWVLLAALAFFALAPIWGGYAQFVCKDTLYAAMVLLLTLQTIRALGHGEPMGTGDLVLYGTSALFCSLLRNNGLYVALPTAAVAVLVAPKGRQRLRLGAVLAAAIGLAVAFSGVLLPALGVRDEQASGLYSVCFQQSARVLRDHGEEVTPEEYAAIDAVLDAARLPELYEPWISDPVKYTFRQYGQGAAAERAALGEYQKAWLAMLRKYPLTYAEAFIGGNSAYYAFLPKLEGATYNNQAGNRFVFEMHPQIATNLDVHTTYVMPRKLRELAALFARGLRHVPGLSLLYCCAFYTWLLVAAGVSLGRQRRWRDLSAFVPALLSLATCLLSPVNDYFRYYLPMVAVTPVLLVFAAGGGQQKAMAQEKAMALQEEDAENALRAG